MKTHMIHDFRSITVSFLFALAGLAHGQDSGFQIRAVLNDPGAQPELFVGTPGKGMTRLNLAREGLAEPQPVSPTDGLLNIFDSDQVTEENAKAHLAATVKIPVGSKSLIVILFPASGAKPSYRAVTVADDTASFPWGDNKVVNLTPVDFAMQIGEQKLPLPGGKVTDVPVGTKAGEVSNLQTNFYYKQGDQWAVATERRLRYMDSLRRVFVISKQPKAVAPDVRTIQDQKVEAYQPPR
jgi:hypothetical protein